MGRLNNFTPKRARIGLCIGIVALAIGGWLAIDEYTFRSNAETISGRVVSVESKTKTNSGGNRRSRNRRTTVYKPTIEYTQSSGQNANWTPSMWSSHWNYVTGTTIELLQSKDDPTDIRIADDFFTSWGLELILVGVGGFMVISNVIYLILFTR